MEQIVKFGNDSLKILKETLQKLNPKSILLLIGKESYAKSGEENLLEQYLSKYFSGFCPIKKNGGDLENNFDLAVIIL